MTISAKTTHALKEQRIIVAIVIASAMVGAACLCFLIAISRSPVKPIVAAVALPIVAFAGILPVYGYVYREAPPGWHINIAEEYRLAAPAGIFIALIVYGAIQEFRCRRAAA